MAQRKANSASDAGSEASSKVTGVEETMLTIVTDAVNPEDQEAHEKVRKELMEKMAEAAALGVSVQAAGITNPLNPFRPIGRAASPSRGSHRQSR